MLKAYKCRTFSEGVNHTVTDEYMKEMLTKTEAYTLVILQAAKNLNKPGTEEIIWEHGRRNFSLRKEGKLSIVCPMIDSTDIKSRNLQHR